MVLREASVGTACGAVSLLKAFDGARYLQTRIHMKAATPNLLEKRKSEKVVGRRLDVGKYLVRLSFLEELSYH